MNNAQYQPPTDPIISETLSADQNGLSKPQRGTVLVDGVGYAVGLVWQPLQNPDDPIPEVRETMESDEELDLYCLRFSSAPQYGLGKKSMGHKEGEPSLAAAVASALSDQSSVCAVFRVKEGWWFVVIRNDLILSEEDILFETEEEAQKAFFSMMAVPDWDKKIAPAHWNIEGAESGSLPDLIKGVRKVRLLEMSAARRTQILLLLAVIVLALIAGVITLLVSLWDTVFTPPKVVSIQAPEVVKPVEPVPEQAKPWEKVVDIDAFSGRCWNYAYQLNVMTIPGWKLEQITCTPTGLKTGWKPAWDKGSRLTYLKTALNEYKISKIDINLDADGKSATGNIAWNDLPITASVPNIEFPQLKHDLNDIVQATALPLNFSEENVLVPPNNPDGSVPPNQQTYRAFNFSVSSSYTPWEWRQFFNKFSGLEMKKITYNPDVDSQQNKWTYEGRIYAK